MRNYKRLSKAQSPRFYNSRFLFKQIQALDSHTDSQRIFMETPPPAKQTTQNTTQAALKSPPNATQATPQRTEHISPAGFDFMQS